MLLEAGAKVSIKNELLHQALNVDVARFLSEHRADVFAKSTNGTTPLHHAVWRGRKSTAHKFE